MQYKEHIISKTIFGIREYFQKLKYYKKRVYKIWRYRKEYFSKDYFAERKAEKILTSNIVENPNHTQNCNKDSSYDGVNSKLAVYTCVFGNYDEIKNPVFMSEYCDYYIVTDQEFPEKCKWNKVVPHSTPEGFEEWHPAIKNRYYKMHPHELFEGYDYSIYLDGNIQPVTDLYPFLEKMKYENKSIALHEHPIFRCLYDSGEHLKKIELVDCELMDKQLERYNAEGLPAKYGFFECGVIVRKHHEEKIIKIMDTWWDEYCKGVKRDQQSFTYALWKNGFNKSYVCSLGSELRKNSRLKISVHKQKHEKV